MDSHCWWSISDKRLWSAKGVNAHRVIKLPDGRTLFYVCFWDDFRVLLVTGKGFELYLFDKRLQLTYTQSLTFLISVVFCTPTSIVFSVDAFVDDDCVQLGSLKMNSRGILEFNCEPIGSENASLLYTKALLLKC